MVFAAVRAETAPGALRSTYPCNVAIFLAFVTLVGFGDVQLHIEHPEELAPYVIVSPSHIILTDIVGTVSCIWADQQVMWVALATCCAIPSIKSLVRVMGTLQRMAVNKCSRASICIKEIGFPDKDLRFVIINAAFCDFVTLISRLA